MRNDEDRWLFAEQGYDTMRRLLRATVVLICLALLFGCGTVPSTSAYPVPSAPGELMAPVKGPIYLQPSTTHSTTTRPTPKPAMT